VGIGTGIVLSAVTCDVVIGTASAIADARAGGDGRGPSAPTGRRSGPPPDPTVRSCARRSRQCAENAPHSPGPVKANAVVT
jgi:hypothetical protein